MGSFEYSLPEAIVKAQISLEPYIKSRQDVAHIRKILSTFLDGQAGHKNDFSTILSLSSLSTTNDSASHVTRSLRKEYLKSLRANVKARQEYHSLKQQSHAGHVVEPPIADEKNRLYGYVSVVQQRQRQERLKVLQQYVDGIVEKSALLEQQLQAVTSGHTTPPPMTCEEAVVTGSAFASSSHRDPETLVFELEKAVLAAKASLKKEQLALQQLKEMNARTPSQANISVGNRMYALGRTRNELIKWVETELGNAAESDVSMGESQEKAYNKDQLEQQLASIKFQYSQYIKVRTRFLKALAEFEAPNLPTLSTDPIVEESDNTKLPVSELLPLLADYMSIAKEQRSLIQQRSHLTTSLAKQYNEMTQGFTRLADESHLLPAYPFPNTLSRSNHGASTTFADDMSAREASKVSDRAKVWTYAAASAATNTKDTVLEHFEEGSIAIEDARQTLAAVDALLGREGAEATFNIWSLLDGNVGVLGRDNV